jgi:hypothetical protein
VYVLLLLFSVGYSWELQAGKLKRRNDKLKTGELLTQATSIERSYNNVEQR